MTLIAAPQAAAALGVSISTLYRWRTQKLLVPGEDWYLKFPSARSPLLYNVEKVQRRIPSLSARSAQELESVLGCGAEGLAQYSGRPGNEDEEENGLAMGISSLVHSCPGN